MTKPRSQSGDLYRKVRSVRSAAQVLQPPARGVVHSGYSTVCGENYHPRAVRRVFHVAGLPQQGRPQALGEVRGEALDKPRLVPRETRLRCLAMQADEAPAGVSHPQHRAQFVPQPERREDVPVAVTARRQLLFQRTLPRFEPSPQSYAPSLRALAGLREVLARNGIAESRHLDMATALVTGLVDQQVSNDPGGDRWIRLIDESIDMFLAHCQQGRAQSRQARGRRTSA